MRDIKFRAWDKQNRVMCQASSKRMSPINTTTSLSSVAESNGYDLMQYTGLKDKNGVEVYEGDIVIMHTEWAGSYYGEDEGGEHENKGVVAIVPSKGVMINRCMKRNIIEWDEGWKKTWAVNVRGYRSEVIGNIYENPELLES